MKDSIQYQDSCRKWCEKSEFLRKKRNHQIVTHATVINVYKEIKI